MMTLSEKIKALRLEQGLTLEQVGDKVGVGKSTVRKWENGIIANMKRDKISKLADALGVSPAYLMGWDEDPKGNITHVQKVKSDSSLLNRLMAYMIMLNPEGQKKLLERAEELQQLPQYIIKGKEKQ